MSRRLLVAVGLLGVVLALPGLARAQAPAQDSVTLTGPATATGSSFTFAISELNATSGPSGEAPSGHVTYDVFFSGGGFFITQSGPVTCLNVNGNTAVIGFFDQTTFNTETTIQAVDNQPDSVEVIALSRAPTDCSPGTTGGGTGGPLSGGDLIIHDAPPLPTSKDQCKNGGWRNYPGFKNQGDCISFVATG
jgi:hypothetical protein